MLAVQDPFPFKSAGVKRTIMPLELLKIGDQLIRFWVDLTLVETSPPEGFRLADDHYRLMVGTTAIKRDLSWLRGHLENEEVSLVDRTEDFAVIGLMGPKSAQIATALNADYLV